MKITYLKTNGFRKFEYTKQELTNCKTELYSLKLKASNNEKNEWYWNETF